MREDTLNLFILQEKEAGSLFVWFDSPIKRIILENLATISTADQSFILNNFIIEN